MTEIEALELVEGMQIAKECEMVKTLDLRATLIKALEDVQAYRAIGTVEDVKDSYIAGYNQGTIDRAEEVIKAREYGYVKAIDEFAEQLGNLLVLRYGNATPTEQYVAMQVTDWCGKIAEQMKGGADYERSI